MSPDQLDRAYAIIGEPNRPIHVGMVSIQIRRGDEDGSLHMRSDHARDMAERILAVSGGAHRSMCAPCLVAGALCGGSVVATIALIIGGILP